MDQAKKDAVAYDMTVGNYFVETADGRAVHERLLDLDKAYDAHYIEYTAKSDRVLAERDDAIRALLYPGGAARIDVLPHKMTEGTQPTEPGRYPRNDYGPNGTRAYYDGNGERGILANAGRPPLGHDLQPRERDEHDR
jgi:hypothetical protein